LINVNETHFDLYGNNFFIMKPLRGFYIFRSIIFLQSFDLYEVSFLDQNYNQTKNRFIFLIMNQI